MTQPSTTRRAGPFYGNDATTAFPFEFKVFSTSDIALTRTDANGIDTELVLDSDYSVTLNVDQASDPGGTINYPISGDPLATGETLVAVGALPYDQTFSFPPGGQYRAQSHENAFDRTVAQIQQLAELAGRSLTLPASAAGANTTLPAPLASNVIGWNQAADALVNYAPSDLATVVVAGTSYCDVFTPTALQTQFVLTADPGSVNALDVALYGVPQINGVDFTVSGTTLTMTTAPGLPPTVEAKLVVRYVAAVPVGSANAQDVTFLQAGTGAVSRDAQSKLREFVSTADFGVVGDGVTDDTTNFNKARAAAVARKKTLFITGTPRITSSLIMFDREHWVFDGCIGNADNSFPGSYLVKASTLNGVCVYIAADGVLIEGGGIIGEVGNGGDGYQIVANGVRLTNPYTYKMGRDGIRVGFDSTGANANSFMLDHPVNVKAVRHGIYLDDEGTDGSGPNPVDANAGTILQPFSQSCGGDGIKVARAYYPVIINACMEFNAGAGVRVSNGARKVSLFGGDLGEANGEDLTIESGAQDTHVFNAFFATWSDAGTRTYVLDSTTNVAFTPGLTFGGGSAGMTFGTRSGWRTRVGDCWHVRVSITLTAKGSSTGFAQITGLPAAMAGAFNGGLVFGNVTGMTGLTGALAGSVAAGTTTANLYISGASGFSAITAAEFTNTATLQFSAIYPAS